MKTVDSTLLAHKAQAATTLTDLLLVGPLPDDSYRGFTLLDVDVTFAPAVSLGSITFKARTGMEMSALQSANDGSVTNAEANTLQPVAGFELEGITQEQIDAGALDKVKFRVFRVNYNDLTAGRCEIVAGGTIGEVKQKVGGLTVLELRSLWQQLMQLTLLGLTSLTCRAKFGSQPYGSAGPDPDAFEEEFPCGYDLTPEWVSGTVTDVGAETTLQFADSSLTGTSFAADYFAPGLVRFLTGDNAGQSVEVDSYDVGSGVIELRFETVNPIQNGDTFEIRRHCTKRWTGHNSCETFWGTDKTLHFRGEPWIPVGQASQLTVPGAGTPQGIGGSNTSSVGSA